MVVSLIHLSNGHVSLEYESADVSAVRKAINARYGRMRRRWFVAAGEITFGGERFATQGEWGHPCLVSTSEIGSDMLSKIASDLEK